MINNYTRPQSIIKQIFETTPDRSQDRINAFIVGAAYQLQRYTDENERAEMNGETFQSSGQSLSYEKLQAGAKVDKDFVKLFGEDLEAKLASIDGTDNTSPNFVLPNPVTPNKIKLVESGTPDIGVKDDAVTNLPAEFAGRDVQVNDVVKINDPRGVRTRVVTGIEKEFTEPTYGSNNDADDGAAANFPTNPSNQPTADNIAVASPFGWSIDSFTGAFDDLINGPSYNDFYGDLFTITVTAGGVAGTAKVSIRSNSGFYQQDNVGVIWSAGFYVLTDYSMFQGVTFELNPGTMVEPGLNKGDQFIIQLKGVYELLSVDDSIAEASRHLLIPAPGNPFFVGSQYTGTKDTTYVIKVIKGTDNGLSGADLYIYDTSGVDKPITISNISESVEYNLGTLGMKFIFRNTPVAPAHDGLRGGDIYTVQVKAPKKEGPASIVVLNGSVIDTTGLSGNNYVLDTVEFFTKFSGELSAKRDIAPDISWEAKDFSVDVVSDLKLFVAGRNAGSEWVSFEDGIGKLFVHYRALTPGSANESIFAVRDNNDIVENAGKIDQDNDLAYGLLMALTGSQGKRIYGGLVASNDLAGYQTILKEASNRDDLYAFAPLTYDTGIIQALQVHINAMSTEQKKQWRRAYFATDTSEPFSKLQLQSDDTDYTATITDDGSGYLRRVVTTNADFVEAGVVKGDKFKTNFVTDAFGDVTYDEFHVALVVNSEELLLETGPTSPENAPVKFEIWSSDDGESTATRVAKISQSYGDRRVVNVWVDSPEVLINQQYVPQEVYFVAAEIAGLRSALLPQQGLTYTEINSVSRASNMYRNYTQEELDIAAANGTFIITQEVKGGPVFIRHQLTTKTQGGSLFYEDSVGVNADEISYAIKDIVQPYIGKRNAVPSTVADLRTAYENVLIERTNAPAFQDIGPQVLSIVPGTLFVEIDETFKDQINMGSDVEMPLPLNKVVVSQVYRTLLS